MSKFLPNVHNRRLFPTFACFCIAAIGVATGFIGAALEVRLVSIAAFVITVVGVTGVFVCILYGWWAILTGRWPIQR